MLFTRIVLAGAMLAILPPLAHAASLDLSYEAPPVEAAPAERPAHSKTLFPVKTLAPLTVNYSCKGPQCQYETDIDQLHEDQTTQHWSIGIQ